MLVLKYYITRLGFACALATKLKIESQSDRLYPLEHEDCIESFSVSLLFTNR